MNRLDIRLLKILTLYIVYNSTPARACFNESCTPKCYVANKVLMMMMVLQSFYVLSESFYNWNGTIFKLAALEDNHLLSFCTVFTWIFIWTSLVFQFFQPRLFFCQPFNRLKRCSFLLDRHLDNGIGQMHHHLRARPYCMSQ